MLERGTLWGVDAPENAALERDWSAYLGRDYCIALNSGTAALHCCAASGGVGPGDEVIVPAFTFVATAMAMVHQGATPVFCDVDQLTYNLDPTLIEERLTDRTKAIVPVHLHGMVADMREIMAVAKKHGLTVIEDAAQAHGATYRGRKAGTFGASAAFSLNATKSLSGGEGGLFVTSDEVAYRIARRLSVFGEDASSTGRDGGRAYVSHGIGWNYRQHELSAALARSQLTRLDRYNATATANARVLTDGLSNLPGIGPPRVPHDRESVWHKYRVRLQPAELGFEGDPTEFRDAVLGALRAEGAEAVLWQKIPVPAHPAFRRGQFPWHSRRESRPASHWDPCEFPVSSALLDSSLVLCSERTPLAVQEPALMHQYVEAVAKVWDHLDELVGTINQNGHQSHGIA